MSSPISMLFLVNPNVDHLSNHFMLTDLQLRCVARFMTRFAHFNRWKVDL